MTLTLSPALVLDTVLLISLLLGYYWLSKLKTTLFPDLQTAQIKIINKFNPFTGFQSPTYILKSRKDVSVDQM
ncbi:unnamed protein product, partial [Brassica oleracea var. botrytis]